MSHPVALGRKDLKMRALCSGTLCEVCLRFPEPQQVNFYLTQFLPCFFFQFL